MYTYAAVELVFPYFTAFKQVSKIVNVIFFSLVWQAAQISQKNCGVDLLSQVKWATFMLGIEIAGILEKYSTQKENDWTTNLFELILEITLFWVEPFLENPSTSVPGVDVTHCISENPGTRRQYRYRHYWKKWSLLLIFSIIHSQDGEGP